MAISQAQTLEMPQAVSDVTIPEALIYEMVNGKPIYYHGWREVVKNEKTLEEVMASSLIQSYLVSEIHAAAHVGLRKKYILGTNEAGLKFDKGDWRAADIALWTKESLKNTPLHNKYSDIIPEIVIEVDTKADSLDEPSYYFDKTKYLHQKGVRRIIWVLTNPEQVMVAERGEKWLVQDWAESVEIADGLFINIKDMIAEYQE
jgi:Uma2 family endonuclease